MEALAPQKPQQYVELPKYPSVYRDISFLVDPTVSVERAQEVIERTGGKLVADVDLFDEYEPAGENTKGLAFHIEYQSMDKTLTDDEVGGVHADITQALKQELDARIR